MLRNSVSPVISALLLSFIAIAAALILYTYMTETPRIRSNVAVIDLKLIKSYWYVKLIVKLYNGENTPQPVSITIYGDSSLRISRTITLPPLESKTIVISGLYGYGFDVGKKYLVVVATPYDTKEFYVECEGVEIPHDKFLFLQLSPRYIAMPNPCFTQGAIQVPKVM